MKTTSLLIVLIILFTYCNTKDITTLENVRDLNEKIAKDISIRSYSFDILVLKQSVREICGTGLENQPPIDNSMDFYPDIDSSYFKEIVSSHNSYRPVIYFRPFKNLEYLDSLIQTIKLDNQNPKIIQFTIGGRIINKDTVGVTAFYLNDTILLESTRIYTFSNNAWTSKIIKENKVGLRRAGSYLKY